MTLAIGDGAGNVSMIEIADAGIGISVQEGRQAVMASDFAMGLVRFLVPLLLVHGYWNYQKMTYMSLHKFYRNVVLVLMLFCVSAAAIHDQSSPRKISNISAVSTKLGELLLQEFLLRKIFAEVIATFLLVFATCGTSALSRNDEHSVSKLAASVAGGLIVTVMIYSAGHISGAHMNPAVTFAFALTRHFPWIQVPLYICAQITGATAAAFTLKAIMVTSLHYHDLGTTTPSAGIYNAFQALTMEIIVTFTLMFVTMSVATDSKAVGELAGLAVGSAVSLASILAGPISGASMNPARTLGPALASNKYNSLWVYFVGPFLGAVMGAWSYTFIRVGNIDDNSKDLKSISQRQTSMFKLRPMELGQPQVNDYMSQGGNFSIV